MDEKQKKIAGSTRDQAEPEALPLSELDKAMKGIVGTDKAEVDAEAKREQRRKAKKPKKSGDC